MDLKEIFEKYNDEYLKFEKIPEHERLSDRPDLHAFILLNQLAPAPNGGDIIGGSEHDEIWLNFNIEKLSEVATEEQIRDLIRAGVRYDDEGLCMFV